MFSQVYEDLSLSTDKKQFQRYPRGLYDPTTNNKIPVRRFLYSGFWPNFEVLDMYPRVLHF